MVDNLRIITNTEEIRIYFNDVKKLSVMTREREDEIFKSLHDAKVTKEEKEKLKTELVYGNLRFVISVAKQYQNNGLEILDLLSEGNIGLLKAVDKFDPKCGYRFFSYAVWWIRQNIMSAINEYGRTIRIPSNLIQEELKSKKLNLSDEFSENDMSYVLPTCVDLSKEIDGEGNQLIDVIKNPNEDNPEGIFNDTEEIKKQVRRLLNTVLDERERIIIEKYYGLNGFEVSLEDLGVEFNCTKERIRQLKDKSIKKLRNESYSLFEFL